MNATICKLAMQALLGRRRFWMLLAFPVALIGLTAVILVLADDEGAAWAMVSMLGYPLVLPMVAILASSSVLGPEVDDGSIVYLLAKPINRYSVALSKWLVAWVATILIGGGSILVTGLMAGEPQRAFAWSVAAVVAGTTYSAFFLAFAAFTRHAVVAALLFVMIWETLLGNLLSGISWLSIRDWGERVGHEVDSQLADPTNLPYAIIASVVVTALSVWFAGDRLRSFSLKGDE